ncbi:hypothetical protein PR001_g12185 [Phytophthora rubi]|uniref:Uncharacterized protein n=1 Tax=Phytophthora rubi TaxID=129364 RepID=A0A6A3M358_9STRA|nr:hypothetical protein PR001_g12185 [Phytophthora rubi]
MLQDTGAFFSTTLQASLCTATVCSAGDFVCPNVFSTSSWKR